MHAQNSTEKRTGLKCKLPTKNKAANILEEKDDRSARISMQRLRLKLYMRNQQFKKLR